MFCLFITMYNVYNVVLSLSPYTEEATATLYRSSHYHTRLAYRFLSVRKEKGLGAVTATQAQATRRRSIVHAIKNSVGPRPHRDKTGDRRTCMHICMHTRTRTAFVVRCYSKNKIICRNTLHASDNSETSSPAHFPSPSPAVPIPFPYSGRACGGG
jgi:hypothetical protein